MPDKVTEVASRVQKALSWQDQRLWKEIWKNNKALVLELCDEDKRNIFHWCVENDCLTFMQDCLDEAKGKIDVFDAPDEGGWTPFHLACAHGNLKIVNTLIKAGARFELPVESTGNTGLHIAASKGHVEICKALLNAYSLKGMDREIMESRNHQGYTPLLKAISADRDEAAKYLLQRHADVWVQDPTSEENILHLAVVGLRGFVC
eukprot:Blabericola_migrator_1__620@NODE_1153_length_5262_cov_26_285467_g786_i0_p3_GENE_NODE_1153_length_5262_cov_26_285467_g786_i0NODE_1153_length_5262_cov_26_285467_g786_i0_p3_ORF_typecomplete_len205_score37_52Ank_4/PF13637_6/7_6e08Ank_4/PF13637_6/1_6e14Ank_4/PF13637_6/4e05Ank_2/PF12796_7/2e10Ank_2/PF12796_7/8e14Ank_5/PF13857_6/5_1e08Ank_5/PF13857_6/9_5e06Ank_5/PF13857_6/3_5e06Ank_3/PF13606_6/1_5e03Ank_3/PF13606_6/1_1e08Ank_3/PF13606_6/3_1e06Ank_3/PF13606_6/0_00021Ank_3/PF13606_6/1_5e03Ank/PF00023_30/